MYFQFQIPNQIFFHGFGQVKALSFSPLLLVESSSNHNLQLEDSQRVCATSLLKKGGLNEEPKGSAGKKHLNQSEQFSRVLK